MFKLPTERGVLAINKPLQDDYLKRNIGWELTKGRDIKLAEAIADPISFVTTRNEEVAKLFAEDGAVTKKFGDTYTLYSEAGLPDEIARNYAMRYAKEEYDHHLDLLELKAPGAYQRAFGAAAIRQEAGHALANIATEGGETVAEYKARKRAKKAAKRQQKALGQ